MENIPISTGLHLNNHMIRIGHNILIVRYGRWTVVLLGTILHFIAFALVFINIPPDAPTNGSENSGNSIVYPSNIGLAMMASFLLGFGDACYNTQTLSLLGK